MEGVPWTMVHGIDPRVWPTEGVPWTIVHGIDPRVWPTEGVPWTIVMVSTAEYGKQKVVHSNGKCTMYHNPWTAEFRQRKVYSPWYRPPTMVNGKCTMDYSLWY